LSYTNNHPIQLKLINIETDHSFTFKQTDLFLNSSWQKYKLWNCIAAAHVRH